MGSVHLVHDEQLGTEVALKTLKLSIGTDLYLFKREFRAMADIRHPSVQDGAIDGHVLSAVDTLRAGDFLLRFLMLALKSGDIRRVAQGLSLLAGQLAVFGGARFGWAMRLSSEAEVLARRSSDSATIGMANRFVTSLEVVLLDGRRG